MWNKSKELGNYLTPISTICSSSRPPPPWAELLRRVPSTHSMISTRGVVRSVCILGTYTPCTNTFEGAATP